MCSHEDGEKLFYNDVIERIERKKKNASEIIVKALT